MKETELSKEYFQELALSSKKINEKIPFGVRKMQSLTSLRSLTSELTTTYNHLQREGLIDYKRLCIKNILGLFS